MADKIVIAKPGFDAQKETNPNNLNFSSDYNTLKYDTSGVLFLNPIIGANLNYIRRTSFTHGLGYCPFFVVYVKDNLMANYQPVGRFQAGSGAVRSFGAYVTTTQLFVTAYGFSGFAGENYTVEFRYKLFLNSLQL